jgi:hypothetical protein
MLVQPGLFSAKNDSQKTGGYGSYLTTGGAVVAGGAFAALAGYYAYYKARNRKFKTEPTPANVTYYGSYKGQAALYSHGFGGNLSDIYYYTKHNNPYFPDHYLFDPEHYHIASFNYPDSTKMRMEVKYDQVSLGQKGDIDRLDYAAKELVKTLTPEQKNIVGFGISRGASTWINYMGTKKNELVKLLILEAPFATIPDVLYHFLKQQYFLSYIPFMSRAAHLLTAALFPQYRRYGEQPINTIDRIDPSVAMLFIHSDKDEVTPPNASRQLYVKRKRKLLELKKSDDNLYLLELSRGRHVYCLREETEEGRLFQNVVHRVLKQHGYPHNESYAEQIPNLKKFQPSITDVEKRIKLHKPKPTTNLSEKEQNQLEQAVINQMESTLP